MLESVTTLKRRYYMYWTLKTGMTENSFLVSQLANTQSTLWLMLVTIVQTAHASP